jgi:hypothetical protein
VGLTLLELFGELRNFLPQAHLLLRICSFEFLVTLVQRIMLLHPVAKVVFESVSCCYAVVAGVDSVASVDCTKVMDTASKQRCVCFGLWSGCEQLDKF